MASYVERNLYQSELIVDKAKRDKWGLIGRWVAGILFCWLLLIPLIFAIKETILFTRTELVLTNKRIVRKSGVFHTKAFDAPLNKISNVYVETTFWGKVFNTNKIRITTAFGVIVDRIENADDFKSRILGQMDQFEEARLALQASWTAQAMARHVEGQNKMGSSNPAQNKRGRYDY